MEKPISKPEVTTVESEVSSLEELFVDPSADGFDGSSLLDDDCHRFSFDTPSSEEFSLEKFVVY